MTLQIETAVNIAAAPAYVWDVMTGIERWADWTASISSIRRLEPGPFRLGSQARIRQPRLPAMVWQVTKFEPGQSFTWEARRWGTVTVAQHHIVSCSPRGSRVVLTVRQSGLLVRVFRSWIEKLTRHNVNLEAQGLKRRCEELTAAA